jgi:hypothetical protein
MGMRRGRRETFKEYCRREEVRSEQGEEPESGEQESLARESNKPPRSGLVQPEVGLLKSGYILPLLVQINQTADF